MANSSEWFLCGDGSSPRIFGFTGAGVVRRIGRMKNLLLLVMAVVLVGCGKKVGVKDIDNEMMKQAMQWDADIKILKLEVEHLKADVKRLQEDNNASSARNKNK